LKLASEEKIRLGDALIKLGVLSEDKITWALGVQFELSYVDLDEEMVDWEFVMTLPVARLRELQCLPLARVGASVYAVVADPTVEGRMEAIGELFPKQQVVLQLASPLEIASLLSKAGAKRGLNSSRAHLERLIEALEDPDARDLRDRVRKIVLGEV
ncbi:MAG: hypothetical protein HY281_14000, partial [Nitrospirae bacterium]|nr:hypothetical protein [Nitrospirota bacterium]